MCGFIGWIVDRPECQDPGWSEELRRMNRLITHRGPDDEGYYMDEHVGFGFRRLSIIDLEAGHQPLSYENDRYWIIFNGEIYNYVELREELTAKGLSFATNSDTEVIVALYSMEQEKAVEKLRGMFAFVIWDKQEKTVFAARDPFGIKPFFYAEQGGRTFFASEKKSLLLALGEETVDHESLQHYLTFQYVPEPSTMSAGISKLEPGHYIKKRVGEPLTIHRYWKPFFRPVRQSEEELVENIRTALVDSVRVHMRSDVPVGAFLSGGIDSSFIVAIAKQFHPDLKTFSVGFERQGFSEIDVAKETAEKLGVDNISYVISPQEYMDELPKIMWHMDDPLADPAAVPLYFVAREARKHVTVVLSGEGADELFGGYNIYREPESLRWLERMPGAVKSVLRFIAKWLPDGVKGKSFLERGTTPLEKRYIGNAKIYSEAEKAALLKTYEKGREYTTVTAPLYQETVHYPPVNRMQYIDLHTWLRGDILVKADKMTMAHSLELRVPFLDKAVFAAAATIAPEMKTANGTTKYILRKAAEGIVPDHVLNRKKLGFPVPIRHWLRNEMYDWAKQLIHDSETDHLFHKDVLYRLLDEHAQQKADHSRKLWTVLTFMIWHQVYVEKKYDFAQSVQNEKRPASVLEA
ncbi:asparagine synthase (glutamine-hydrolyzing) [Geobacillus sp. FSL W8-0032]|uniref:asparagine synthase (glutamine-hydrolyzing) n=1 Tax=Geobacillus subterraneus TaxID=129338 RepID=A0A679FKV8_9BACL|nr:asparagine synthase (glutamine-hydrolyzing) [Geobacillus subterraneus]BBW96988.1 asparagine synthetase B [Geobacillus subterraneus]